MEWYFGSDGDDLVVPMDREPLDRFLSPDSWSDWGISEFPKKDFDGKSFCDEVDINISGHEMECLSNSSMSYGLENSLRQWATLSREQPDYQLNDLARMDQMDDIFLNSLLDEDVTTDNLYGSSSFSPQSHYSMMSADNLSTDSILESKHTPRHTYGVGGSKNIQTHAFSPKTDWKNTEVDTTCPYVEAPVLNDYVPSEHDIERGYVYEETYSEESVLQELGRVTSKLTEKTRSCFRDSLYRLAENSKKQTLNLVRNGDLVEEKHPVEIVHDDTLRVGDTEARESKTNAIDRAIANLMFTTMDFCAEDSPAASSLNFCAEDSPAASSLNFKREANETTEQLKYSSNKPWGPCFTMLGGDAEVPIIGKEKLLPPTRNLHTDFSGSAVNILSRH